MANVYVFNATPYTIQYLEVNGFPVGNLAAIAQSSGYAAASLSVGRNPAKGNPGTNQFGGQNVLLVLPPAGGGAGQSYAVNIDQNQMQLNYDLQLYIFYNSVVLVGPLGTATQLVIQGTPVSERQAEEIRKKASQQR